MEPERAKRGVRRDVTPDPIPGAMPSGAPASPPQAFYSPPCSRAEIDPAYLGPLTNAELLALLDDLLEGERAGARGISELCLPIAGAGLRRMLHGVAKDEGRFCSMLHRHIVRLGGEPSMATGAFLQKLAAQDGLYELLSLLNRGQGWVVRRLREALPRIGDEALRRDLEDMLAAHEANIELCTEMLNDLGC